MMTYLRSSILATIAYYDTLDYPVTLLEVYKFLVNPGRVHSVQDGFGDIALDDVRRELETLIKLTVISQDGGYYYMNHRDELCAERERRGAIASRKWKKFLSYAKFLVLAPYLKGFFASGSMALSNTTSDSDWDVLIIVKHNRMYTARLFLWFIASMLGVRRKPGQEAAPDKLCFNHFLTDKNLTLEHESMYNAQSYANLKPVYVNEGLFFDFFRSNNWIHNYIYNFEPARHMTGRSVIANKFFLVIARVLEKILNTPLGDLIEKKLKTYQQKRIASNPVTHTPGGRIIYNDRELEFHPYSFEKFVIEKYKENLRKLGVVSYIEEKDSGLTK